MNALTPSQITTELCMCVCVCVERIKVCLRIFCAEYVLRLRPVSFFSSSVHFFVEITNDLTFTEHLQHVRSTVLLDWHELDLIELGLMNSLERTVMGGGRGPPVPPLSNGEKPWSCQRGRPPAL